MQPILVTGGTGTLGRHVVRRLREAGHEVGVLTRQTLEDEIGIRFVTGDLLSGEGIDTAVDDVATIIHCAGSSKGDEVATQHLVDAAWSALDQPGTPPRSTPLPVEEGEYAPV